MDNASFHRKNKLTEIIKGTGISLLFLPAYSPDFNPCEKKWANLKQALPDILPNHNTLQEAIMDYLSG
jgi:transposase